MSEDNMDTWNEQFQKEFEQFQKEEDAREEQRQRKLEQYQQEEAFRYDQYQKEVKRIRSESFFDLLAHWLPFLALFILSFFSLSPHANISNQILFAISFFLLVLSPLYYSPILHVKQIDDAFSRLEREIPTKTQIYYPIGFGGIHGGSSLWHAIHSSAIYQFRRKNGSYFDILDSSNPASCAWAAAWFYANHYLTTVESFRTLPSEPDNIFSKEISPLELDLLDFVLRLGDYGYKHSFIGLTSWYKSYNQLSTHYTVWYPKQPAVTEALNSVTPPEF